MGISMAVLSATDAQLRQFPREVAALERLLNSTISGPGSDDWIHLHDNWDLLHFLLTDQGRITRLPLAALKVSEVAYPDTSDPTHAIFSHTTRELARRLQHLQSSKLRRRLDLSRLSDDDRARYRPRGVLSRMRWGEDHDTDELWAECKSYLDKLRALASRAAGEKSGLLFCRFEDW